MASFKLTLRVMWDKKSPELQAYPIYFKLKLPKCPPNWKSTKVYVKDRGQWDPVARRVQKCQDAAAKNVLLATKLAAALKRLTEAEFFGQPLTTDLLIDDEETDKQPVTGLFEYMKSVYKHPRKVRNVITNIIQFQKTEPKLQDITIEWARKFQTFLENKTYGKKKKKLKQKSIFTIFQVLRRVTLQAVKEKYLKEAPVGEDGHNMPERGESDPVFLVKEEREKLLNALLNNEVTDPSERRTLTYFMLSCYAGFRFGDLCKFDLHQHIIVNRIVLRTNKNNELVRMPIREGFSLDKILKLVREVGPLAIEYEKYQRRIKRIAKRYGIKKRITTHVARHSFGRFCAEQEITISDCAEYMGITEAQAATYYHMTEELRDKQNWEKLAA